MTRQIGLFERMGPAIQAIEELRRLGIGAEQIRVIAQNEDMAWRVDAETDVPVDRLEGKDAGRQVDGDLYAQEPDGPAPIPAIPLAAASPTYLGDTVGIGTPPIAPLAPLIGSRVSEVGYDGTPYLFDSEHGPSVLRDLGLSDSDADTVGERIEQGALLVVVESKASLAPSAREALASSGASFIDSAP